jgi:hypothetical protein
MVEGRALEPEARLPPGLCGVNSNFKPHVTVWGVGRARLCSEGCARQACEVAQERGKRAPRSGGRPQSGERARVGHWGRPRRRVAVWLPRGGGVLALCAPVVSHAM